MKPKFKINQKVFIHPEIEESRALQHAQNGLWRMSHVLSAVILFIIINQINIQL